MSAQHRDYMGQLPGHPAGIPAGLGKSELNERHTEDFIQTTRTILPHLAERGFKHRVSEKAGSRMLNFSNCV